MKYSILTIHHIHNFGSIFQAYSLFRFLEKQGLDVDLIDYRPAYYEHGKSRIKTMVGRALNLRAYYGRKRKFERFLANHDKLSAERFTTLSALAAKYKNDNRVYIAGGDQLWNDYHPCGRDDAYKLTFAKSGKKLAYGTSMGRDTFTAEELTELAYKVKDFEGIMLRESSGVRMLQSYSDVPLAHVIDPVGLLDVEEFAKIAKRPDIKEPYAVMYLADSGDLLDEAVRRLSQDMGLKIVHICGFKKKCYCDVMEKDLGPEEILGYILHADFVLSASFHATMFSLLFQKPFATLLPGAKTNARIEDILRYVGLENRIVNSAKSLDVLAEPIPYEAVSEKIAAFKANSQQLLLQTLGIDMEEQA